MLTTLFSSPYLGINLMLKDGETLLFITDDLEILETIDASIWEPTTQEIADAFDRAVDKYIEGGEGAFLYDCGVAAKEAFRQSDYYKECLEYDKENEQ